MLAVCIHKFAPGFYWLKIASVAATAWLERDCVLASEPYIGSGTIEAHDADGRPHGNSSRLERMLIVFDDMAAEVMVDAVIGGAIDYADGERENNTTVVVSRLL